VIIFIKSVFFIHPSFVIQLVLKIQCDSSLGHIINTSLFRGKTTVERKVFTMEVSGRANGVSFSETDQWDQDEVTRLTGSCRPLGKVCPSHNQSRATYALVFG